MNPQTYYDSMKLLAPSYGIMPTEYKKAIVDYMREHPDTRCEPASDKELAAIFNYLNHTSMDVDFLENPGFTRYKDAVLCINYEHTGWVLLERRPDEQLWDLFQYIQSHYEDRKFDKTMANIYSLK